MDIEIEAENIYLKNKVVSKLDLFVVDFINILKKYMDYVVVSGYVSILFGRSRGLKILISLSIKSIWKHSSNFIMNLSKKITGS